MIQLDQHLKCPELMPIWGQLYRKKGDLNVQNKSINLYINKIYSTRKRNKNLV